MFDGLIGDVVEEVVDRITFSKDPEDRNDAKHSGLKFVNISKVTVKSQDYCRTTDDTELSEGLVYLMTRVVEKGKVTCAHSVLIEDATILEQEDGTYSIVKIK